MKVLIISSAKFPEGDAEAVRLHAIGKIMRDIGYNVSYACMGYSEYLQKYKFDGFEYISLRKKYKNKYERIYFYLNYKKRLKNFITNKIKEEKIDVILFADLSPMVINMLKNICHKNNIKLVADSVEWYSPEQFKLGNFSPQMILKNIENQYVIDKHIDVISISEYLNIHFTRKGCKSIVIPSILDVQNLECKKVNNLEKLTLVYAGSPGRKDYIKEILEGIILLNEYERKKIDFIVIGVKREQLENVFDSEELYILDSCVKFLGRVDRKVVLDTLSMADFTVLLRESKKRYAKAGFPTKVVESLATSTPVILNYSSDLEKYIRDNKEGLIVKDCSSNELVKALRRALKMSIRDKDIMKYNARKRAEENFDYRAYKKVLKDILGD